MKNNPFNLNSITSQCDLVNCPIDYLCKEIRQTNNICIPYNEPDIEILIDNFINTTVTKFHISNTSEGKNLVIYAFFHIKVLYVANSSYEKLHSVNFDIPFSTSVSLGNIRSEISEVRISIKNGYIDQLDYRNLKIHTLLSINPILGNNKTSYKSNFNDDKLTESKNYFYTENMEDTNLKNTTDSISNCTNNSQLKNNVNNTTNDSSEIEFNIEYDMNLASVPKDYNV